MTFRSLGLAEALAGCIHDRRNLAQVVHPLSAMLRFRMFAFACGYEDADDCDALRADPLFKVAAGKAPESGRALCSHPTTSIHLVAKEHVAVDEESSAQVSRI